MAPPVLTVVVALDMSKTFDTISTHTLIRKLLHTTVQAQSYSSPQTTIRDAKHILHTETIQRQF